MRNVLRMLTAATIAGLMVSADAQPVLAQKQYMDAFSEKYPTLAEQVKAETCKVCHGKQKKQRNEFAKALEKALGEKKVKDKDKINEALDKAAKEEYADGKTYGDLFKDGKLPAPFAE